MAEFGDAGLLTDAEQYMVAHPEAQQRALALHALVLYGPQLGIGADAFAEQAATIRVMDKQTARKFGKSLRKTVQALRTVGTASQETSATHGGGGSNFDFGEAVDAAQDATSAPESAASGVVVQEEAADTPLDMPHAAEPAGAMQESIDHEPHMSGWLSTVTEKQLDAIQDPDEAMQQVRTGALELIGDADLFDDARCQALLSQLRGYGQEIPESMSDAYLQELIGTYITSSKFTSMSSRIVNSICFSAYEKGVSLDAIVPYRAITKTGAKKADVNNARSAVKFGVIKSWQIAEEQRSIDRHHDDATLVAMTARYGTPPAVAEEKEVVVPSPVIEQHERSLDEEPGHVREANYYIEVLGLGPTYRAACESLFNPDANGGLTDNMRDIVRTLNERLTAVSPERDSLNTLVTDNVRGKAMLRRLLGRYNDPTGRLLVKPTVRLRDQLLRETPAERAAAIGAFYKVLSQVRALLETSPEPALAGEARPSKPLYRINGEGRVELHGNE